MNTTGCGDDGKIERRSVLCAAVATLVAGSLGSIALAGCASGNTSAKTGKVGPELLALSESYQQAQRTGSAFRPSDPLLMVIDDRVIVDATATTDAQALKADLVALGMRNAVAFGRIVSGQLPISAIPALATLESLAFVRAATSSRSSAPRGMPTPTRP